MVEVEDGEFGGGDGATEEDLGRLVRLDGMSNYVHGEAGKGTYLYKRRDLVQRQCYHMLALTRFYR